MAAGTTFFTGLVLFKYAKIERISPSDKCRKLCQGIGGNKSRLPGSPLYFPWRKAVKNCSSVQLPIPVGSELIFAAKDIPHGPIVAVRSGVNNIQGLLAASPALV